LFASSGQHCVALHSAAPGRKKEVVMGFVKYIDFSALSDEEREALQKLLESQKEELLEALRNANQGLSALKKQAKKAAKKSKKKSKK
jgi:succinate dehydrogenase flavin-adding protein (antitoxin of CptAB toxin-antitoxin module)